MKIVVFLLLLITFSAKVSAESQVSYVLGGMSMEVPTKELADVSPWIWLKSFAGLDVNVDGFIFELDPKNVEGYEFKHSQSKIVGSVSDFSNENLTKFSDGYAYESLWYAQLDFKDREIIKHEESGLYLVYASKGYRGMFYVFSIFPDKDKKMPNNKWDFLVAICSGSSVSKHKNVSCSRQFLVQDKLLVSYSFSLGNLPLQEKLDSYVRHKVISWIVK
ncbi:hypothetical protein AAEH84_19605 [Shewanella indica]|jgi:hypothetical protein|uniref:TNF family profile domain-containing protein n=1 Tax=Shewanella chilikensis TaxID=558541 RepID=A0A6G7LPY7_9GAMM|nr:hypothetical protein [Shewanella chilikensis]QIJ03858.1 hypothetical protein GII14_06475 [Shewanella chilikensis]